MLGWWGWRRQHISQSYKASSTGLSRCYKGYYISFACIYRYIHMYIPCIIALSLWIDSIFQPWHVCSRRIRYLFVFVSITVYLSSSKKQYVMRSTSQLVTLVCASVRIKLFSLSSSTFVLSFSHNFLFDIYCYILTILDVIIELFRDLHE